MTDELADDSDDEKRLFRAENRAGRKLKASKTKGKRTKGRFPYADARNSFRPNVALGQQPSSAAVDGGIGVQKTTLSVAGPCFQCGKMGHLRRSCPLASAK